MMSSPKGLAHNHARLQDHTSLRPLSCPVIRYQKDGAVLDLTVSEYTTLQLGRGCADALGLDLSLDAICDRDEPVPVDEALISSMQE